MVDGFFIVLVCIGVAALISIANKLFSSGDDPIQDNEGHYLPKAIEVDHPVIVGESSIQKVENSKRRWIFDGLKKFLRSHFHRKELSEIRTIWLRKDWVILLLTFFIAVIFFGYLSVYRIGTPDQSQSSFYNYCLLQYEFLKGYFPIAGLVFGSLIFIFIAWALLVKRSFQKKHVLYFLSIGAIVIVAFNISFLATYAFSFVETRYLQYEITRDQAAHNLIWNNDAIVSKLKSEVVAPRIAKADENVSNQIVRYIITNRGNKGDYYLHRVLNPVLDKYSINLGIPDDSPLLMYGDNLYIRKLEKVSYEAISPTLGKLLVKGTMVGRNIKDEPSLLVMDREEYNTFRIDQINVRIAKMEDAIEKVTKVVNAYASDVANDKAKINYNVGMANSMIDEGDSTYSSCIRAESCIYNYIPGTCTYYPYVYCSPGRSYETCSPRYSYSYCSSQRDFYYNLSDGYTRNANEWRDQLGYDQYQLNIYAELRDIIKGYKAMAEASREEVPFELGLFDPNVGIKVVLESDRPETVADNIDILVHEYLHYTSHSSEDKILPNFFEEGLTEYFSRKIVDKTMGVETYLGYPLITKVIERMVEKIPESKFEDIYFSKDSDLLARTLDEAFGKDFFSKNEIYFDFISYIPPKDALDITNKFLEKIGAQGITEDDLYSKASEFKSN